MRGVIHSLILLVIVTLVTCEVPTQLRYQLNKQYVYAVKGLVDAKGADVTSNDRTNGSVGSLTSTLVMEPVKQDSTSYTFVMNMFDTDVEVAQSVSEGQSEGVSVAPADGSTPMGDDMYFQQSFDGQIIKIWYNTEDSPYYVNVKMSAINSFQTYFTGVGVTKTITENDPVGVHTTKVEGASGSNSALVLNKEFTQTDFSKFADTTIKPNNVQINAKSSVTVHSDGHVLTSSVTQYSVISNINKAKATRDLSNSTGFDMNLSSLGTLTHSLSKILDSASYSLQSNMNMTGYVEDTLFSAAVKSAAAALVAAHNVPHVVDKLAAVFEVNTLTGSQISALNKIGNHMRYFPEDSHILLPYVREVRVLGDDVQLDKLFYLLGVAQHEVFLITYGIESSEQHIRDRAIIACASLVDPSPQIMDSLLYEALRSNSFAIHVFGILAGRSEEPKFGDIVEERLRASLEDGDDVISWINAAGNAGPTIVKKDTLTSIISNHPSTSVREAAVYALRKHAKEEGAREGGFKLGASDFPFNKSITEDVKVGGKVVSADFSVDLFAGTNFDCKQKTFNYKASASASATATIFGRSEQAFDAQAVYGADNGQQLADVITLSVWGDVIYNKPIPHVDCNPHSYPLAHTAPGFSVSYTLWVSIVPVVFTASASLKLDLTWGWQVCDAQLAATVDLVPTGSLVVSGGVTVDLLLLRAGFDLNAQFNEKIVPSLYIHGSECEIGFNVQEDANAMSAEFDSYFQWRDCKYLIFDCHWGKHNQKDWWHWDRPATQRSLFNAAWKIAQ